jgi:lipoprotein-anchoring transpeptidase ErfK/SrfK
MLPMTKRSFLLLAAAVAPLLACAAIAPKQSLPAALAQMTPAQRVSEKMGAPVDVFYRHMGAVKSSGDPSMQISFVPRVASNNLKVEMTPDAGVVIDNGAAPLLLNKAEARGVYNRYLNVRRTIAAPANIRAVVSVDVGGARFFSVFSIPADASSAASQSQKAGKKPTRKQPAL